MNRDSDTAAHETSELSESVFVYGELRRRGSEAFRMEGARYVRLGEVAGTLLEISGVPALVPRRGSGGWVTGELFQMSPDLQHALDAIGESAAETGGSCYQRVRMKVYQPGTPNLLGEAWVWQRIDSATTGRVVRSGDWMDVSHPRPAPWCTLTATACLIGFFVSLGDFTSSSPAMLAAPLYRRALVYLISVIPAVACVTAWWGLRRRERYEFLAVLVLVVSALLALPLGLSMGVEIIEWLIRRRF